MSNPIITSLTAIDQLSRRNERASIRFRTRVKRLAMGDEELDAVVGKAAAEVERQVDCTACANCCRTLQVVVDEVDIGRLARYLGLPAAELERRYVKRAPDGVKHIAKSPCPFLEANRCSVYEERPEACRDFPYLHAPGFRKRTWMMIDNASRCPIVFNTLEKLKKELR